MSHFDFISYLKRISMLTILLSKRSKVINPFSGFRGKDKEKLFYPFMTVDSTENLRRLGLPYMQATVARHSGDIHVDSAVGKGTSISFSLPIIQTEKKEAETQAEAELNRRAQEILKRKRPSA